MMTALEGFEIQITALIPFATYVPRRHYCGLTADCGPPATLGHTYVSQPFRPKRERALAVRGAARKQNNGTPHPWQ